MRYGERPFHGNGAVSTLARWVFPVILGLGFGLASVFMPGALFIAGFSAVLAFGLSRMARPTDRRFLTGLFLSGLLVRVLLSLALDFGSFRAEGAWPAKTGPVERWNLGITDLTRRYLKLGDSDYNSERGYALAKYVQGVREPIVLLRFKQNRPHGYLYVIGLFYHFFDFSPISVKWINGLIGALLGAVVFFLTRRICGPSISRLASVLVSFFPSMVLWSVTNLKEPIFILLAAVLLLLAVRIRHAKQLRWMLIYGGAFVLILRAHMTLRSDAGFSWMLAACVLLSFPLSWMGFRRRLLVLGFLPIVVGAAIIAVPGAAEKLSFVFYRHMGNFYADQTSMTYSYLPVSLHADFRVMDPSDWADLVRTQPLLLAQAICQAVFHYLLEPLPGRTSDLFTLMVGPQMILWYVLLLWALVGMIVGLRRYAGVIPFVATTAVAWSISGALAAGNVGLVFRVRDMVTPLFLIFSSIGIHSCLFRRDHAAD